MRASFLKPLLIILVTALPAVAVRPFQPREDDGGPQQRLVRNSGYIFSGTVKAVERIAPRDRNSVPVMRVTFQIEEGLRGARRGETLTIREWAGLWQSGERYRVGERVMLFLYPPSKLGLTSPVGGGAGRFRVDPQGNVVVGPRHADRPRLGGHTRFSGQERLPPRKLFLSLREGEP